MGHTTACNQSDAAFQTVILRPFQKHPRWKKKKKTHTAADDGSPRKHGLPRREQTQRATGLPAQPRGDGDLLEAVAVRVAHGRRGCFRTGGPPIHPPTPLRSNTAVVKKKPFWRFKQKNFFGTSNSKPFRTLQKAQTFWHFKQKKPLWHFSEKPPSGLVHTQTLGRDWVGTHSPQPPPAPKSQKEIPPVWAFA